MAKGGGAQVKAWRLRRMLQALVDHGRLIQYSLSPRWGQWVYVWGEDGRPVRMSLGSAQVYAWRLEDREWGLLK